MKTVLIVEDDLIVRETLIRFSRELFGDAVLFSTATLKSATKAARKHPPDLVMYDLTLPDCYGLEGVQQLKSICPESCIIIFSGRFLPSDISKAKLAGAAGFLPKSRFNLHTLASAIREIENGTQIFLDNQDISAEVSKNYSGLTDRENECLRLFLHGKTIAEVAHEVGTSVSYVKVVRKSIRDKLGPDILTS